MVLRCDECDKGLGTYLDGLGGVREKASVRGKGRNFLPDIVCHECIKKMPTFTARE